MLSCFRDYNFGNRRIFTAMYSRLAENSWRTLQLFRGWGVEEREGGRGEFSPLSLSSYSWYRPLSHFLDLMQGVDGRLSLAVPEIVAHTSLKSSHQQRILFLSRPSAIIYSLCSVITFIRPTRDQTEIYYDIDVFLPDRVCTASKMYWIYIAYVEQRPMWRKQIDDFITEIVLKCEFNFLS